MRLSDEHNDMGYRGMSECKHIKPYNMVTTCANCYQELQAENAALKKDIQTMVEKAAAKHRPAYDEQQKIIMELQAQVDALIEAARIRRETPLTEKEILSIIYSIGKPDDSLQKALTYEKGPYSVDCVTEKAMKFAAAIHATLLPPLPTTPDKQAD